MTKYKFSSDRVVDSTGNNEYAEGMRDETLVDDDLIDTDKAYDDLDLDNIDEFQDGERPLYDEEGYEHDPAD